jgi:hypothetical protein
MADPHDFIFIFTAFLIVFLQGGYLAAAQGHGLTSVLDHHIGCCESLQVSSDDRRKWYYISFLHSNMTHCCLKFPFVGR